MGSIQASLTSCSSAGSRGKKGSFISSAPIQHMDPGFQIVLCAGAPDTPEIADTKWKRCRRGARRQKRPDVIWIEEMVDRKSVIELYSHAAVFCCPSIYEPFGIINLEAMACETAVVASAVGGIKEVVVDGETGFLVPLEQMQRESIRTDRSREIFTRSCRKNQRAHGRSTIAGEIWKSRAQTGGRKIQLVCNRAGERRRFMKR